MGMMHTLRNRMHIILWLLLILFIGSMTVGGLVGGADIINQLFGKTDVAKTIGVVNGETIPPDEFFRQVNVRLDGLRSQGQELDDRQLDQVRSTVWNEMIELKLVDQEIEKRRIVVTDEEIYYHLLNSPPQFVQGIPYFQTDGKFDRDKYLAEIQNPVEELWKPIELLVRDYLPRQKFYNQIKAGAQVTEEQVLNEFIKRNIDFTISALVIRAYGIEGDTVVPTENEIENHYLMKPEEFKQEEACILSYVKWDKKPSQNDTTLVRQEIQELLERIQNGEDFANLANEFSQDPGNKGPDGEGKGGDLGWFKRGQMVEPFEEAAFGADKGDYVGPVASTFGHHLIWVKDKRSTEDGEEVNASHILLEVNMGPSTRQKIRNQANRFSFDVEDYGFDEAVQMNGLSITTLRPIQENAKFIPGFGFFTAPARFAFSSETERDAVSDALESEGSFAVFHLDSIIVAGEKPFDEVKSQIKQKLKLEKQMELARFIVEEAYERAKEGTTFEDLNNSNKKLTLVGPVTRKLSASFPSIGRNSTVTGALLTSEPGNLLPPLEISNGYVIIRFEARDEFDESEWEVQKEAISNELLSDRQNTAVREWLGEIRDNAKIVDNRKYYF